MTPADYLATVTDQELTEYWDWFTADSEPGEVSGGLCRTQYGPVTKTMIESEISRRSRVLIDGA
jgi:hypothetical protein